jgi:hypothetical protein
MSKKKSKFNQLPSKFKSHRALSPLERSMMPTNGTPIDLDAIVYYGSNGNENESKVEGNRNG